ncbi:Similar to Tob1: Protein Tob1 (Rattus norvegicus) [Cotesia congregata]|uniref:Similar to Tob1: Protein Tob1 (Rattus norvegicus) n=1 Tax=Cotesia congregata TaxID=51543 RepID=A0A8J2HC48_COTCN|nr:Similar to Tob1: Protein Tob1 (Rattus norvegicus) [Cotesia congregata]
MDIEVQVALNFVISYLYNKLPRRRVNIFGEELEKALKDKFQGHWYPEKPFKGSAFRCLKTGDPIDPVLERAAKESGVPIQDILENLPTELAVWVDPGEVSYRIGEKNMIKILYSESADLHDESSADREVTKTFNPEAQCFRPIEAVGTSLSGLSLSPKSTSPFPSSLGSSASNGSSNNQSGHGSGSSSAPSPTPITNSFKGSPRVGSPSQPQQPQQHTDPSAYFFPGPYHPQFTHRNIFDSSSHGGYLPDLYGAKFPSSYLDPSNISHQFYGGVGGGSSPASNLGPIGSAVSSSSANSQQEKTTLVDGLNNFGLGSVTPYPASQYQHLLVAN